MARLRATVPNQLQSRGVSPYIVTHLQALLPSPTEVRRSTRGLPWSKRHRHSDEVSGCVRFRNEVHPQLRPRVHRNRGREWQDQRRWRQHRLHHQYAATGNCEDDTKENNVMISTSARHAGALSSKRRPAWCIWKYKHGSQHWELYIPRDSKITLNVGPISIWDIKEPLRPTSGLAVTPTEMSVCW